MKESKFHRQKREAFESFFEFEDGKSSPQWPIEIFLEISNICDLKCAMCPTFSSLNPYRFTNLRQENRGVMDIEKGTRPLESLLEHASVVHAHGYGESTIHPDFNEFIGYLSGFEVLIDFFTNGMHLSQEVCDLLVDNAIFRVTVSFSGATAEEYNNVYLGGEYDTVLAGIQRLSDTKKEKNSRYPRIDINSIGFKHHVDQLPAFVRTMGEHGVNGIHLKPLSTYDQIPDLHQHKAQFDDKAEQLIAEAQMVANDYDLKLYTKPFESSPADVEPPESGEEVVEIVDLKKQSRNVVQVKQEIVRVTKAYQPSKDKHFQHQGTPCMEPFKTLYASFSGDIYPCCFKGTERGLGKLSSDSDAHSIWRGKEYEQLRKGILGDSYPDQLCGACVRKNTYPKKHGMDSIVRRYSDWFLERFGMPFHSHVQKRSRSSLSNREIVRNRKRTGRIFGR